MEKGVFVNQLVKSKIEQLDYWLLIPFAVLSAIGLVMVYSASSDVMAIKDVTPIYYFQRQIAFLIVGILAGIFIFFMNPKLLENAIIIQIGMIILIVMLMLLFVLGTATNGAISWLNLGSLGIQPSEFIKLILVLFLAKAFSKREAEVQPSFWQTVKVFIKPIIWSAVIFVLVFLQPDTGGAAILGMVTLVLFISCGFSYRYGIIAFLMTGGLAYGFIRLLPSINFTGSAQYKINRIIAFLQPFKLENGDGRQLVNSYYAINNGGFFGVGLGNSIQKRGYLPEPYTDFILSIITEELGVIGALIILSLLFILIARVFLIGIRAKETFHTLVCYGIGTILFMQVLFNVGGLLGLLPITGVTLPFISYGGSSLIMLTCAIAIVLNIDVAEKRLKI